jgi:hypothetical protein
MGGLVGAREGPRTAEWALARLCQAAAVCATAAQAQLNDPNIWLQLAAVKDPSVENRLKAFCYKSGLLSPGRWDIPISILMKHSKSSRTTLRSFES